jgi:hypothetical protein
MLQFNLSIFFLYLPKRNHETSWKVKKWIFASSGEDN